MAENKKFDEKSVKDRPVPLYVASFEEKSGTILLRDGGSREVAFSGEILVTRSSDQQALGIKEFRRISLWIESVDELEGLVSFAGPANEIAIDPGPIGTVELFDVRLYYPILGRLDPACEESDAAYPQWEILRGALSWALDERSNERTLRMQITVKLDELIMQRVGAPDKDAIVGLTFESVELFHRLEEQKAELPQANSLASCADPPPSGGSRDQRALRLRFVSLSRIKTSSADLVDLEETVDKQIKGACKVWWEKGGIKIEPHPTNVHPVTPDPSKYTCASGATGTCVSYYQENSVATLSAVSGAVEVYLVDRLTGNSSYPRTGGGVTKNCGSSGAFVILEIEKAENNKYLLAHELGHVLGLSHPLSAGGDGCPGYPPGSDCSVMVPDNPNSSRNTAYNLTTLAMPLGPVFTQLYDSSGDPLKCGLKADDPEGYYHIIRDFPYDDGREFPVPEPPFTNWWSDSDVWNALKPPKPGLNKEKLYNDGTHMFALDYHNSPNHDEPRRSGINYMYVRLHTCETLNHPVYVYLYLAVPGSSSHSLTLLPVSSGTPYPMVFSSVDGTLPRAGAPVTRYVPWTVPLGYPTNCCVFAVAQSNNETTPPEISAVISSPGSHDFYSLFSCLKKYNDVAQRNLHIDNTTSSSGASSESWLSWVEMSNPFDETAAASLEVDATLASGMESLILEVNDQPLTEIPVGSSKHVPLTDALRPEDRMVLRFKATLPPGVPQGTTFPIDLRFFVDDQLVSGYRHMLRVTPVSRVIIQVLDLLFGALSDVAVAFESEGAQKLATELREIVLRVEELVSPPGCWGRIRAFYRRRWWNWLAEWVKLTDGFEALARSLETGADMKTERQLVCQHLYALAALRTSAGRSLPDQVVEQIREHADRIQELAGRLARRLPKV